MSDTEMPVFPTSAPTVFTDPTATRALFGPVLAELARVVDIDDDRLGGPTPCGGFDVAALRAHVLGWLQFFAAALNDPAGTSARLDPTTWELGADELPSDIVLRAAADIDRAIDAGVASELVVMSQARMTGDAVLAMALGEYLIHGWDLAAAADRPWDAVEAAVEPALTFLDGMIQPEYRGPESGFFDDEIEAPPDASAFERLLCFAGRDPGWSPER